MGGCGVDAADADSERSGGARDLRSGDHRAALAGDLTQRNRYGADTTRTEHVYVDRVFLIRESK